MIPQNPKGEQATVDSRSREGESGSVLIVDDEASMRLTLSMLLRGEGFRVVEAGGVAEALRRIERESFDVVITDLKMEKEDGVELLKAVKQASPASEVIILTAYGTIRSAVEAVKLGAYHYLTKPFEPEELVHVVRKALERRALMRQVESLRAQVRDRWGLERIVAKSQKMQGVLELVRRVADTDATILIQGESGTGKELIAKAIHSRSRRASHPFVPVECGALPEPLLESELFGHVRGAFTGALASKKGLFEEADGGTIFLDEIGTMPLSTQVKLLRVLQEQTIRRVGSTTAATINVRIVAASNQELRHMVERKAFREDLYYRLNGIVITIPPLRERQEDIIPLAGHFLRYFTEQLGKPVVGISPEAMELLLRSPWPGNVRELEKAIERAVVLGQSETITVQDLPSTLTGSPEPGPQPLSRKGLSLAEVEKAHILAVLYERGWNQARAAEELGISRVTLWRKLREYGMRSPYSETFSE